MTSLTKQTLTTAVLSILILSMSNLDATAACSGSRGKKNAHRNSYKRHHNYHKNNKLHKKTAKKISQPIHVEKAPQSAETKIAAEPKIPATTISQTTVSEITDPSPSDKPAEVKYMVIQESKPGSGLDTGDTSNPTLNRGIFDSLADAEETAEMWRDVMPGWEVEVREIPAK